MRWLNLLRVGAMVFFAAMIVWGVYRFRGATWQDVLHYVPENVWLAAAVLLFLYALKSLTVAFPIKALYIGAGILFRPWGLWLGIAVNALGIAACVSLPWLIGRFSGQALLERLIEKYPKAKQMDRLKRDNAFFFVYLVKLIGIIPCDISSMILGAMDIPFWSMVGGSVLGMLPAMIATTVLGANVMNPRSPSLYLSFGMVIVLSLLSTLLYRKVIQRKHPKGEGDFADIL